MIGPLLLPKLRRRSQRFSKRRRPRGGKTLSADGSSAWRTICNARTVATVLCSPRATSRIGVSPNRAARLSHTVRRGVSTLAGPCGVGAEAPRASCLDARHHALNQPHADCAKCASAARFFLISVFSQLWRFSIAQTKRSGGHMEISSAGYALTTIINHRNRARMY